MAHTSEEWCSIIAWMGAPRPSQRRRRHPSTSCVVGGREGFISPLRPSCDCAGEEGGRGGGRKEEMTVMNGTKRGEQRRRGKKIGLIGIGGRPRRRRRKRSQKGGRYRSPMLPKRRSFPLWEVEWNRGREERSICTYGFRPLNLDCKLPYYTVRLLAHQIQNLRIETQYS